jgi:hypothetical protein
MTDKKKRIYIDEIEGRIEEIRAVARDYERAHSMEDDLFRDVLAAIADGQQSARKLAIEVLKSREIEFPRYSA